MNKLLVLLLFAVFFVGADKGATMQGGPDGEYRWIAEIDTERWKQGDFGSCCGPDDCFPVKAIYSVRKGVLGFIIEDRFGGWVPEKGTTPSRDPRQRHWRCYEVKYGPDGRMVELIRPRAGCFFPKGTQ